MREKGFSLMEIIIGAFVVGIATIGIYKAMASYIEMTKTQTEYARVERMSRLINFDFMKVQIPSTSNISDFLKKWAGENIQANSFSREYYLILPNNINNINTNNLCSNLSSVNSVFKVKTTNGNVLDDVLYLLVSPTGKGTSTIEINNLSSSTNLIYVNSDSIIEISPFDIVKFETKTSYKAFCDEISTAGGGGSEAKKYAGCDYLIENDVDMDSIVSMSSSYLQGKTVCIEPGNYNTNLNISGDNTILKQTNPGEVRVNSVSFSGSGYVRDLILRANYSSRVWGNYAFYNCDIEIMQVSNGIYAGNITLNGSRLNINMPVGYRFRSITLSLTNSTMTVGGDVEVRRISSGNGNYYGGNLSLSNSTMTVGGSVFVDSGLSLSNSTMTVGRNVIAYGGNISLSNSTMTVGRNVSAYGGLSLSNSTMTATAGDVSAGGGVNFRDSCIRAFRLWDGSALYTPVTTLYLNTKLVHPNGNCN